MIFPTNINQIKICQNIPAMFCYSDVHLLYSRHSATTPAHTHSEYSIIST